VLAGDRQYCEWLEQQDWFRGKFPAIHTLIINHFGQPKETPEHNALQALFVDENFRARFVLHILGGRDTVQNKLLKQRDAEIADKQDARAEAQKKMQEHTIELQNRIAECENPSLTLGWSSRASRKNTA
jgi:hypothetical protein